jgi:excisionase family DNA binding protein
MSEKKFYSPKEAAEVLTLSSSTIARRLKDGYLPHVKIGSRVLIPSSYFDTLAASASAPKTE